MLICAMDIATQSGVCSGEPGAIPAFETVRFHGEDRLQIAASAIKWCAGRTLRPDRAYLEKPMSFGAAQGQSNAKTLTRLNTLYDIVGGAFLLRGARVVGIDVKDARVAFIGERQLERDQAKKRCLIMCQLLGWPATNGDEADAAAVWYWGCCCEAPKIAAVVHPGLHAKARSIALSKALLDDRVPA